MPTPRFYQVAACAVAFAAAPVAQAVLFHSTGDPTFNTTPPTGTLANSGWQYQITRGENLATAVGPNHYVTAAHTGAAAGFSFVYNGVTYNTTSVVADFGDIRLLSVDKTFLSYAPLYDLATGSEQNDPMVVIGRGTRRGDEFRVGGVLKGWHWGAIDGVQRWGTNHVDGLNSTQDGSTLLRFDFDLNSDVNEAMVSDKDSGGGLFIKVGQQWTLAGITYGVSGPYSVPPDDEQYRAALFDASGTFDHSTGLPGAGPTTGYATAISQYAAALKGHLNLPPTWKVNNNGSWTTASNWSLPSGGSVPNAVGAIADFRTVIGQARTVTYTGTTTVGTLNFDSPHSYSIVPGVSAPSQLNLNVASGSAAINVASGNHSVSGVVPQDPLVLNVVRADSTLSLGMSAHAQPITKEGSGTLSVSRLQSGAVAVNAGSIVMNGNGAADSTSKVAGLSVNTAAGAVIDLKDNDIVVANTPLGSWNGSSYTGLTGLIASSYNFSEWNGPGITTSMPDAGPTIGRATIGITNGEGYYGHLAGSETAIWSGQTIAANDALIAYTWAGDVDLNGYVDAVDYGTIDQWIQFPGTTGYTNGDLNYDGVIDAVDYGIIDNGIQLQGPPLIPPPSESSETFAAMSVSAVPEPAALSLAAIASAALLARRRRFRR